MTGILLKIFHLPMGLHEVQHTDLRCLLKFGKWIHPRDPSPSQKQNISTTLEVSFMAVSSVPLSAYSMKQLLVSFLTPRFSTMSHTWNDVLCPLFWLASFIWCVFVTCVIVCTSRLLFSLLLLIVLNIISLNGYSTICCWFPHLLLDIRGASRFSLGE